MANSLFRILVTSVFAVSFLSIISSPVFAGTSEANVYQATIEGMT